MTVIYVNIYQRGKVKLFYILYFIIIRYRQLVQWCRNEKKSRERNDLVYT